MKEIFKFRFSNKKLMDLSHKIRYNVFVIGQNCPEEMEWEFEEDSIHFLLIYNKKPVATARYRKTKKGYKLERFAVPKSERKKGYGHIILNAILKELKNKKSKIYLHAQTQVIDFYKKLGFYIVGDEFEEAGIKHYEMQLAQN